MKTGYTFYLKEKCNCKPFRDDAPHLKECKGFTRGPNITELIERLGSEVFSDVEVWNRIENLIEVVKE